MQPGSLDHARPHVGQPLSDGLSIDFDPIAVPRSELPGVSRRLGKADEHNPDCRRNNDREICREIGDVRQDHGWQAAGHVTDQSDLEVEQTCRQDPKGDEYQGSGRSADPEAKTQNDPERQHADDERREVGVTEGSDPAAELARCSCRRPRSRSVWEALPRSLPKPLEQEALDHRLGEELGHPPHPQLAEDEEQPGEQSHPTHER